MGEHQRNGAFWRDWLDPVDCSAISTSDQGSEPAEIVDLRNPRASWRHFQGIGDEQPQPPIESKAKGHSPVFFYEKGGTVGYAGVNQRLAKELLEYRCRGSNRERQSLWLRGIDPATHLFNVSKGG